VDYFAGIITVQQQILSDYSAEDISVLYFSQYPEQIGREIDFQEQRSWLLGELHDERLSTVQQSAFLSLAGSLATQPTACESSPIPGVMFESPILTGAFNAFGPTISLQEMADGYELTFCNTRQITTLKMGSNQQFVPCVTIENLNQNTLWVHSPTIQTNTTRVVADNAEIYYTARYSFDFTDTAVSGSARFLRDQFSSRMLENISANLAGSMAQGASRFTSRMIGFIPVAGDIISFAIDMGTDYMAEKAEAEQNLSDALATLDAVRLSAYCTDLRLTTVVVSDGTPAQQLLLYPGPRTPQILQNINAYLVDNEDVVLPEGLIPPITESDVLGNPGGVDALLQGMSDRDHNRVLDQWG
jgi:hypothetical protein